MTDKYDLSSIDTLPAAPTSAPSKYDLGGIDAMPAASGFDKTASLFAASIGNPSEEAERRRLESDITRITGFREPVADIREATRRRQQLEADHVTRASPRTSLFLSAPENAAVAIQDAKTMAQIEAIIGGDPLRSLEIAAKRGAMSTGALGAKVGFDFPAVATDIIGESLRGVGVSDEYNVFKAMSASARRNAVATRSAIEYFTPEARNMVERAAASAGESAGMSLQLAPLAAATPQGAGMAAAFGLTTFAESYTKAREAGKGPLDSLKYAIPQGAFEGLFEMAPAAFLADAIKNAPGLKQFTLGLIGKEVPSELQTTLAQNLNDWVTFNPGKSVSDFIAEQPEALAETAIATVMGAGIQAGLIHGAQRVTGQFQVAQEERRLKQQAEVMQKLFEQAKNIKSDPVTFKSFMDGVTDNATVFVNADDLQQVLAQNGMSVDVLPTAAETLAAGPSVTGDVEIPVGELMTAFAGTPAQEQIVQHTRVRQDDLSQAQWEQMGDIGAFLKSQTKEVQERQKQNEQFQSELDEIEASFTGQLPGVPNIATAGYGSRDQQLVGRMVRHFYAVAADRMGVSPKQVADLWSVKFPGAEQAEAAPALTQGFDHGNAMLNVGLDVGATDRAQQVTPEFVKAEIEKLGVQVLSAKEVPGEYEYEGKMVQELTYVPQLSRPLTEAEVNQLAVATGQEAIGQYDNGVGNLWGPNAAAWGAFNPEFFKDQAGTKLSDAQKELAQSMSSRRPTTKKNPEDHLGEVPLVIDYNKIEEEKDVQNMALVAKYPGLRFKARKPAGRVEEFIQHVTDNLLWLHDQIPADIRQRSKLWYDGARAITDRWTAKYSLSDMQIAAVLAIYSPQKDWFMNVSLAERTLDIVKNHQDTAWSDEMSEVADDILADEKFALAREAIRGKKLSELTDKLEQAMWVRVFDEAHNNRGHRLATPEGGFVEFAKSIKGVDKKTGWPGFGTIIKALYVIEDGSAKMIDTAIGGEHKVRSFYNNIFHPTSNLGFVTIDTHAVAAGLLRPLSGNSVEVTHNFGGAGTATSAATGMSGTYAYYQEAYRRAAEARGLLPREMQSITWEAVRELYTMGFKHDKAKMAAVDKLWSEYEKGKRELDSVRSEILALAGGVEKPAWVGHDSGLSPEGWASSYTGELLGDQLPGRAAGAVDAGPGERAAAGTAAADLAQAVRSAGAVAGPVVGIHYSQQPRTSLASSAFGSGMPGAERERLAAATDPRIKQRVAFYVNTGSGITPESGVGPHPHVATLRNLYDADADALKIWRNSKGDMNAAESAVLDAGFDGYLTRSFGRQGTVVMLGNRSADVQSVKREDVDTVAELPPSAEIPKMKQAAMAILQNTKLPFGRQSVESWKRDLERSDPDTAALIDWAKIPAGDYYKDQIAGQLWQTTFRPVDTNAPEFKAWARDAEVLERDDTFSHDFVSEQPVVVQVIHGTTGDFTTFDRDRAAVESDMGAGIYATNDELDASANYAGEGPDLTNRLEYRAEQIESFLEDDDSMEGKTRDEIRAEAKRRAREELAVQNQGFAMPVWMRFEKPFVLGGPSETQMTYETLYDEETDEYGEETGTLVDFIVELRSVAEQYSGGELEGFVGALLEKAADGVVSATELFEAASNAEMFYYFENNEGQLVSKEIIRQTLENLGYDGIIDQTVDAKFGSSKKRGQPMRGVTQDTKHFIVFSPEQIKSAISNTGEFSDENANILFAEAAGPRRGSFNPLSFELRLTEHANRTTLIHELSHFFMAAYIEMAQQPNAPAELTEFVENLLGYLFKTVQGGEQVGGDGLGQKVLADLTETLFFPQTSEEKKQGYANRLKNPVTLKDGTRLSGFTDPIRQSTFLGYDKNGGPITIRREYVNPGDIVFSKDSNKTAEKLREGLRNAQQLAQEVGAGGTAILLAPNGKRSKLTEQQWLQVRTPEFKAWFGDWEKHAANPVGSLWSDDSVSKIVDENGEPLVVYHGTQQGGFDVFRPEKGDKHRSPMLFATADAGTARSYSGRPSEIEVQSAATDVEARRVGKEWYAIDKGGDGSYAYNVYGDYVPIADAESYINKKEAEFFINTDLTAARQDSGDLQRGIYHLFLNIRDPNEVDFEGANWDGQQYDRYEVWDTENEENVYADDGSAVMSEDDAIALAEAQGDPDRYIARQAPDRGETTNSVAEDAKRYGNDGAIIRNVVDDGGKHGYGVDPSDVFVFFDSNQVKSATQNTGAFSRTDDSILRQGGDTAQPGPLPEGRTNIERWNAMTLDQQRPYWEHFAEQWEQYAMTGKAPTKALQAAFSAFAKWMKSVYQSFKNFLLQNPQAKPLDPEITQYFDRMLATEAELDAAREERGYKALFKAAADAGMSPSQFADYMALDELQKTEANELLLSRSLRDMKWLSNAKSKAIKEIQAEADELRALVRASVEEELADTPIRKAERWLRKGEMVQDGEQIKATAGFKLNAEIVKAMFPQGAVDSVDLAKLKQMMSSTGTQHPDDVAAIFGFRNGETLVRELLELQPFKDEAQQLTDLRMLEEHGDLATPEAIEKAADAAIHNAAHLKMVATEVWALNNRIGSVAALAKAAKEFAKNLIGNTTVKKLSPSSYANAATRAGKMASRAVAKKETDVAAKEKRVEMINAAAAKEAYAAEAEVRAMMNRLRKIAAYSDKHSSVTSREFSVVQAVRAILGEFEIGSKGEKAQTYVATVSEYDPMLGARLKEVIDILTESPKPWAELTVDELRELHAEIGGLWTVAREIRTVELAGEKMTLDEARQQLLDKLSENRKSGKDGKAFSLTDAEIRSQDFMSFVARGVRPESWISMKDGNDQYGPWRRLIWNAIDRAQLGYNADKADKLKQLKALLETVAADMKDVQIDAPELGGTFGAGNVIGYSELLHAILHTGNESNKTKLLVGRGWGGIREDGTLDSTKWDAFMKRMWTEGKITKTHMDFVQGIWDLMESMKEGAQKAHRATTGRYFEEIQATEIVTPFGTYRGGYVPAIVDRRLVADADVRKALEESQTDVLQTFEKPAGGFTKSRVKNYNSKLELNIAALGRHIDQVMLFTHMSVPVRNVQRVLRGPALSKELSEQDRSALTKVIMPWLHGAATQTVTERGSMSYENLELLTKARSRAGAALMFANISNSVQQLTGFFPALLKTDSKELLFAAAKGWYKPRELAAHVSELSPYMKQRLDNEVHAMAEEIDHILLNPTRFEKAQDWAIAHSYFLQMAVDSAMSPVIWQAKFNETIARGGSQQEAVDLADSAVRMTQGSNRAIDIAAMERGSPFYRLFMQFAGYFNTQINLVGEKITAAKTLPSVPAKYGRIGMVLWLGWLAPAIASALVVQLFRGGVEDDDDDGEWLDDWLTATLIGAPFKYAAAAVPVFGQTIVAAMNSFNDKPYDDRISMSPAVSIVEGGYRGGKALVGAFEDPTKAGRAIRDIGTFLSLFTGVPITPVTKAIGYATDVETGKVAPTGPVDYGRGIITGTASPESKR